MLEGRGETLQICSTYHLMTAFMVVRDKACARKQVNGSINAAWVDYWISVMALMLWAYTAAVPCFSASIVEGHVAKEVGQTPASGNRMSTNKRKYSIAQSWVRRSASRYASRSS